MPLPTPDFLQGVDSAQKDQFKQWLDAQEAQATAKPNEDNARDPDAIDQALPQAEHAFIAPQSYRHGLGIVQAQPSVPPEKYEEERMREALSHGESPETAARYAHFLIPDSELAWKHAGPSAPAVDTTKQTFVDSNKPKPAAVPGGAGGGAGDAGGAGAMGMRIGANGQPVADFDNPYFTQAAGALSDAEAKAQGRDIEGQMAGQRADLLQGQQADLLRHAQERDQMLQDHEAKIQGMMDDVAKDKVDPEHWWHSQSTARQITYGLAAALGGFVSGYRGGPNSALNMITDKINADIDAQKENILNKRRNIDSAHGLLADMYRRFGRLDQAELAARDIGLQTADAQLKQLMAGPLSEQARAQGLQLQGQLDEQRQVHKMQMAEYYDKLAMQLAMRRAKGGAGVSDKELRLYGGKVAPLARTREALATAAADLKNPDPAGINPVKQWLGEHGLTRWMISDEGLKNQADVAAAKNEITKNMGRFSPGSQAAIARLFGSGSPESVRHGIQIGMNELRAQQAAIDAGFNPNTVRTYNEQLTDAMGAAFGGDESDPEMEPLAK